MNARFSSSRSGLGSVLPYLVWVALAVLLFVGAGEVRNLHVIWSYDWQAPRGTSYGDFAARHYTRCSYLGWGWHLHTEYPTDGTCGWVRFVRKAEGTQ